MNILTGSSYGKKKKGKSLDVTRVRLLESSGRDRRDYLSANLLTGMTRTKIRTEKYAKYH